MNRNVVRGTALGLIGQAWHLLTAMLLYAFLTRRLGPGSFGDWRVVITVLGWLEIVLAAGVAKVATKSISEQPAEVGRIGRAAYLGQAALAAVLFTVLVAGAAPIAAALGNPQLVWLLRVAALDIPVFGIFMIASGIVLGLQRFERQAVAWIVYATAKAVLIALLASTALTLTGALLGNALSSLVGLAVMFVPLPGRRATHGSLSPLAKWMLLASAPFLAVALLDGLGQSLDLWLFSTVVRGGALLGLYASATIVAEVPVFLFLGLNRVIFASVADAEAAGDESSACRYATLSVRTAIIVTVMGIAFIAAAGRQVLAFLFSAPYALAYVPLVLLMVAAMGRTVMACSGDVLLAENRRASAVRMFSLAVLAEAVFVIVLGARFGARGVAAGAAVGALTGAAVAVYALRASVGRRPFVTLARSAVASAVVCVPLALLAPAPVWVVIAAPVCGLAYFALLRLVGELTPADLASLRAALGSGRSTPGAA